MIDHLLWFLVLHCLAVELHLGQWLAGVGIDESTNRWLLAGAAVLLGSRRSANDRLNRLMGYLEGYLRGFITRTLRSLHEFAAGDGGIHRKDWRQTPTENLLISALFVALTAGLTGYLSLVSSKLITDPTVSPDTVHGLVVIFGGFYLFLSCWAAIPLAELFRRSCVHNLRQTVGYLLGVVVGGVVVGLSLVFVDAKYRFPFTQSYGEPIAFVAAILAYLAIGLLFYTEWRNSLEWRGSQRLLPQQTRGSAAEGRRFLEFPA